MAQSPGADTVEFRQETRGESSSFDSSASSYQSLSSYIPKQKKRKSQNPSPSTIKTPSHTELETQKGSNARLGSDNVRKQHVKEDSTPIEGEEAPQPRATNPSSMAGQKKAEENLNLVFETKNFKVKTNVGLKFVPGSAAEKEHITNKFLKALVNNNIEKVALLLATYCNSSRHPNSKVDLSQQNQATQEKQNELSRNVLDINGTMPFNKVSSLTATGSNFSEKDNQSIGSSYTSVTYLHYAAWYGYTNLATTLLNFGADPNARTNGRGFTPLHLAVLHNNTAMCEILLHYGADIEAKDVLGTSAIQLAVSIASTRTVDLLISDNRLQLSAAAVTLRGSIDSIKYPKAIDFSQKDSRGYPLLILSYIDREFSFSAMTKYLLENFPKIFGLESGRLNEIDDKGLSLLDYAVKSGDLDALVYLTAKGAKTGNINSFLNLAVTVYKEGEYGNRLNGKNTYYTFVLALKCLIENHFNKNLTFDFVDPTTGQNVLHCLSSISWKAEEVTEDLLIGDEVYMDIISDFLVDNELVYVDENTKIEDISTFVALAKFIHENSSVDINARTKLGNSVVHLACINSNAELLQYFLAHGAYFAAPNAAGRLPIHLAIKSNSVDCVKILLDSSNYRTERDKKIYVNTYSEDIAGVTPLVLACGGLDLRKFRRNSSETKHFDEFEKEYSTKEVEMVKLLLDNGSKLLKPCHKTKFNCFHAAALQNKIEILKYLLLYFHYHCNRFKSNKVDTSLFERVVNLNEAVNGYTPLHYAAEQNNVEICKVLLMFGANPHKINFKGFTPVDLAMQRGKSHLGCFNLLSEFGVVDKDIKVLTQEEITVEAENILNETKNRCMEQPLTANHIRKVKRLIKNATVVNDDLDV